MTTISTQARAAQAGASGETSGAKSDAPHAQTARFSAVYKNNVTFAHAHHSHHLAQATSAKARQLAAALRKRQAAARAAGKRFAPSQRAGSNGRAPAKGAHAANAKAPLRKPAGDRVTRDGRQGGGGGGGGDQRQQEGGQQNGKQRDNPREHEHEYDSALDGVSATRAAGSVDAFAPARADAMRGEEIRVAIGETLLKLRDGIAAGNVPSADRALQSLMQRIHHVRATGGALAPSTPAAKRELLMAVSRRIGQTVLDVAQAAVSSESPTVPGGSSVDKSSADLAHRVNLLANLVLLVLERPSAPGQVTRGCYLNAALLGAIDARLRAAPRA